MSPPPGNEEQPGRSQKLGEPTPEPISVPLGEPISTTGRGWPMSAAGAHDAQHDTQPSWIDRASSDEPRAEADFFAREAQAWAAVDKRRSAQLLHELGHLHETAFRDERLAAKTYASALTADPTFQATAWALRRIFMRRGFWDNLTRVLDAEARFAALPADSDRADLLVEKAWLLEVRMDRPGDAAAVYEAALELCPGHPGALWSQWLKGLRSGVDADVQPALAGLLRQATSPALKAALAVTLARLPRQSLVLPPDEGAARAIDTLVKSLAAGADPGPVLSELDCVSVLAGRADLRLRALDALESRLQKSGESTVVDVAAVAAVAREKALLLLKRGARDGALAVLDRALRLVPSHPLLLADFLDVAELANRATVMTADGDAALPRVDARDRSMFVLSQAEIAIRLGAWGEAARGLQDEVFEPRLSELADLARLRVLAALQDFEGLAHLFEDQARKPSQPPAEAAHMLVRAATVREAGLGDVAGAERLLRAALVFDPAHRAAREGLLALSAHDRQWPQVTTLLRTDLESETDRDRAVSLRESLVVLLRDIAGDHASAWTLQRQIVRERGSIRDFVRLVDLATLAALPESTAEVVHGLERLAEELRSVPPVASALRVAIARLWEESGRDADAEDLYRQAFAAYHSPLSAAPLERRYDLARQTERIQAVLTAELWAAEQSRDLDRGRALRFRLAHHATRARQWTEALAVLEPLRRGDDEWAWAWSLDTARRSGDPRTVAALLREPWSGPDARAPAAAAERALQQGQAEQELGHASEAMAAFSRAAALHPDDSVIAEATLGLMRAALAARDVPALMESLNRLADVAGPDLGGLLGEEARLCGLSIAQPAARDTAPGRHSPVTEWLAAVRSGDTHAMTEARADLARACHNVRVAGALWTTVAMRRHLADQPGFDVACLAAAEAGDPEALIIATDLLAAQASTAVHDLTIERAQGLGQQGDAEATVVALLLDAAFASERSGLLRQAAAEYGHALTLEPQSWEAGEGLRRVAHLAGDRRTEAALLHWLGDGLLTPVRAAQTLVEAGLLLEAEGDREGAAVCFEKVLRHTPDDEDAYRRLHDIAKAQGPGARLERVIGFKLSRPSLTLRERAALYYERALVRLAQAGQRGGAIEDLKRAVQADPHHFESLQRLGALAFEDRRYGAAARVWERALGEAPPDAAAGLHLQLAEAYESDGDLTAATRILRALLSLQPQDAPAREQLVALHVRQGDFGRAIDELGLVADAQHDAKDRAHVEIRRGKLARDHMGNPELALRGFCSALTLEPLGDAAAELAILVPRYLSAGGAELGVIQKAVSVLRAELAQDPFDALRLSRLADLAQVCGAYGLSAAARQLLMVVTPESPELAHPTRRLGPPPDLRRPLTRTRLAALAGDDAPPAWWADAWDQVAAATARFEAPASGSPAWGGPDFGQGRLSFAWVEAAASAIGLTGLTIEISDHDPTFVDAMADTEPHLVLGRAVVAGDAAARFRVGRTLALLRLNGLAVLRWSEATLSQVFVAVASLAGAKRLPAGPFDPSKATAKLIAKTLSRRAVKALSAYATALETDPVDLPAWRRGLVRAANRFALLLAGDVVQSLRALVGSNPGSQFPTEHAAARELALFALSDAYQALRAEVGLADEP